MLCREILWQLFTPLVSAHPTSESFRPYSLKRYEDHRVTRQRLYTGPVQGPLAFQVNCHQRELRGMVSSRSYPFPPGAPICGRVKDKRDEPCRSCQAADIFSAHPRGSLRMDTSPRRRQSSAVGAATEGQAGARQCSEIQPAVRTLSDFGSGLDAGRWY